MPRRRRRRRRPRRKPLLPTGNAGRAWWAVVALLTLAAAYLAYDQIANRHHLSDDLDALLTRHANAQGLDPALVRAVVITESGGDPRAHSPANARGLMQVTPITHRDAIQRFGLPPADDDKLYEPDYNLDVGTRYLAYLLERFEGDLKLALAGYHMGPTAVARLRDANPTLNTDQLLALDDHGQVGPKTRAYVANVLQRAGMAEE